MPPERAIESSTELEILWSSDKITADLIAAWTPHLLKDLGLQLCRLQRGLTPNSFRPIPHIGANVRELVIGPHHVVYFLKLDECVQILHSSATRPRTQPDFHDIAIAKERLTKRRKPEKAERAKSTKSANQGNVFCDLGFTRREAIALRTKSLLFIALQEAIDSSGLTQSELADLLRVDQPKISKVRYGKFGDFSLDRIFEYLTLLRYDIQFNVYKCELATAIGAVTLVSGNRLALN